MTSKEIFELDSKYVLGTYGRRPLALERGEGVELFDYEGNRSLDFFSGLGVNGLGHSDPDIIAAIEEQASKLLHVTNLFHIGPQAELARELCEKSFADKVFFCNSGTEGVEGALKFARKWGTKFEKNRWKIVVFKNSFHGRTFGSLSATIQEKYRKNFFPLLPGFMVAEFNDLASVRAALTEDTVGVLIEPLQGEGGVNLARGDFMRGLRKLCSELGILLILDEVQCGLGRMGTLFAYEYYGVMPDIIILAKPLAGGLPIGAVLVTDEVANEIEPGDHAATFGGNPFITAVGVTALRKLSDPAFLRNIRETGGYLASRLEELKKKHPLIKEVRGVGLLQGVLIGEEAAYFVEAMEKRGILISSAGPQVVRFIPPLIVTQEHVDRVIEAFDDVLSEKANMPQGQHEV